VDTPAVSRVRDAVLEDAKLDYLLAGHSHFDHTWDSSVGSDSMDRDLLTRGLVSTAVFLAASAALLLPTAGLAKDTGGLPTARLAPIEDEYFGTRVVDPYRWMETAGSAELKEWLEAQAHFTGAVLERIAGSTSTAEGFHALYAMSPYHQLRDGVAYPAVLLETGVNDPRVEAWQMAKMAARLQATSSSGRPVLLRVDYDTGHFAATTDQTEQLLADEWSFLLWQFKDPQFQPSN
jgi:hypothetical protein